MSANKREIRILPSPEAIAETAAAEFLRAAEEAVSKKGLFYVALAGGSTPKARNRAMCLGVLLRWSSPRMTWVMPISKSSTTLTK